MKIFGHRLFGKLPERLRSWRHMAPEHHHVCFRCLSSDKLTTIALEKQGQCVGFLFTCGWCLMETRAGVGLAWRITGTED